MVAGLYFFHNWNQKPVEWTHKEVAALLESWINDNVDDRGWDYFESCEIANPELEKIRQEALAAICFESPYIDPKHKPGIHLNGSGKTLFMELKSKCLGA